MAPLPRTQASLQEEANKALGELLSTKSSIKAHQWKLGLGAGHGSLPKMSPKQPNLSRKPRLFLTQLSRKPKPHVIAPYMRPKHFAPRLKPPALTPYRRPKPFAPQPSGTQRPGEPSRLAHFKNHMLSPSCAWKSKLLGRRTRVSLTSSPPVKLLYEPALLSSRVC